MHRRHRRRNNQRKIIILSIIGLLFIMVVGYSAFQTNLNINVKGNIVERSRVIQNWGKTSDEDFHTDYYRENIVSATFLDSNVVPSEAVESWDVSVNQDKGVMAYVVTNTDDNTKYDLYIGANKGVIANEDSSYLFNCFISLKTINFNNNFDTSNAIYMRNMFSPVKQDSGTILTSSLIEIKGLENFDTYNVVNMSYMFEYNTKLTSLNIENWRTNNVTAMHGMFYNCRSLTSLDVSKWDTSNVTSMIWMFVSCVKLTELNLCSWDTSKVTNMQEIFRNTTSLTKIKVGPNWTTANADTTDMFIYSGVSDVTTGEC